MPFKKSLLYLFLCFFALRGFGQPQKSYNGADIAHMVQKLSVTGSVLYVAAHPDDENTRLLAYLANEKKVRTAYISLTRGDGGQNLIGTEIGPLLGLIRSYELMAARKVDRAEQFFTRAYDFGYSKNPEETFAIWDREAVLADFVYIIRYYKPDIMITRFATDGSGGHGHHTASALLAEEAFKAAGDPGRFPEQLATVDVWQPKRLLYNNAARFRNPEADMSGNIPLNVGKYNPLLGRSYGEIAGLSRSMHKSQGFGSANAKGEILEYFKPIAGDTPKEDIFEDIPTGLDRIKGSQRFAKLVDSIQKQLNLFEPQQIVPLLIKAHKAAQEMKDKFWREIKTREVEDLMLACTGMWLETCSTETYLTPGETATIQLLGINRSDIPITLDSLRIGNNTFSLQKSLEENKAYSDKISIQVPEHKSNGGPYWLKTWPEKGVFDLDNQEQLKKPVDEAHLEAQIAVTIGGTPLQFSRPVLYKWVDPTQGEQFRLTEMVPPVMLNIPDPVILFTKNEPRVFKIQLRAGKDKVQGELRLDLPSGFKTEPEKLSFSQDKKNQETLLEFKIYPPASWSESKTFSIKAVATVDGVTYSRGFREIKYDHIPIQVLFPESVASVVLLEWRGNNRSVAYIPGAGDEVRKGIEAMGYMVTELAADQLEKTDLTRFQTIVMGIRAFNTSERLIANLPLLHQYVQEGGNLIVQYNTNSWAGPLKTEFGPLPLKIGRSRVTDENAPIDFDKNDPLMIYPNRISERDFQGWVQERGLYFASEWDPAYRTPFKMADPGEELQQGSLVILPHGKGNFIYTGIAFFRQIPAGVPGAFRLLSNLIEAGNEQP